MVARSVTTGVSGRTSTLAMRHSSDLFGTPLYLSPAQDIERSVYECVPADFRTGVDRARNVSRIVNSMDLPFIPLAQVKVFAVEAEVRAGKLRTGKQFLEAVSRRVAIDVAVIIDALANREPTAVIRGYSRPHDSGRIEFLDDLPLVAVDPVKGAEITRTQPKLLPIPSQRLRRHSRRG